MRTHEHLYAQKKNSGFLGTALPLMIFVRILLLSGFAILWRAQAPASKYTNAGVFVEERVSINRSEGVVVQASPEAIFTVFEHTDG